MIREMIFVRAPGARFVHDAVARAEHYLDHIVKSGGDTQREQAAIALSAAIELFAGSKLCDRLRRLPAARVFAPDSSACDLLVVDVRGKRYGIRFVAGPRPALRAVPAADRLATVATIDEVMTYDLHTGKVERIARASRLCA